MIGNYINRSQLVIAVIATAFLFTLSLAQSPNDSNINQNKNDDYQAGLEALRNEAFDLAIEKLTAAIAKAPGAVNIYSILGDIYSRLNRNEEAIDAYQQFIKAAHHVDEEVIRAHYQLGKLYLGLSNYQAAADEYHWLTKSGGLVKSQTETRPMILNPQILIGPPGAQNAEVKHKVETGPNKSDSIVLPDLAIYLSDLFPKEIAEQYHIPQNLLVDSSDESDQIPPINQNGVGRPIILYKTRARYTEIARQNKLQGTVVLSVVFNKEGNIDQIKVIRGLPDGLTRAAIQAAVQTRFQPATKDGTPIDVRGNLQYSFNLY